MALTSYRDLIREHSDRNRCDLSRLLGNASAFSQLASDLTEPFRDTGATHVAAIEAAGLALGGAVAHGLGVGVVMLRKAGKTAWTTRSMQFIDYGGELKTLELPDDALKPGDQVVLVDDWSETGGQLRAAISLIESYGANVLGIAAINIDAAARLDPILSRYRLHAAIKY